MSDSTTSPSVQRERRELMAELSRRYETGQRRQRWVYLRKKYFWHLVVGGAAALKRGLDVLVALVSLMWLSPLLLGVAAAIKLQDGGPIFYVARRVGRWGREFPFPKFRSMAIDADKRQAELQAASQHADHRTFKIKRDPRVTRLGRILRRFSIDELPQLLCVLRGDMSLVGPRPPTPNEVADYRLADRRRLHVTPGLTGLWQVSGRGDVGFDEMVELDLDYIESRSLLFDLKLLWRTVPAVLLGRGAY